MTRDYKVLVKPDFPKCHEPAVGLYIKCDNGYTSEEFAVPDWTTFAPGKAKVCELEYTTFCECGTSKTKKVIVEVSIPRWWSVSSHLAQCQTAVLTAATVAVLSGRYEDTSYRSYR